MSKNYVTIAKTIEANPLGRLMYGQRELFHSNLLAWLFDTLPSVADSVFQPFARSGKGLERRVDRERGHLDLVMQWPGYAPLVIENKVFSIPSSRQLEGYAESTKKWSEPPSLMLLSMSAPDFDPDPWQPVSYAMLASMLDEALPKTESYEFATVRKYIELIRDLDQLVADVDIQSRAEPIWGNEEIFGAITSPQMRAALYKARAQRVARELNEYLQDVAHPVDSGMSNATPLVQSLVQVQAEGSSLALGWQLQGAQFRRAVVYKDSPSQGSSVEKRKMREDRSRKLPQLFKFPPNLPQEHSGRKEFNHYAPDFVYQYVKTPNLTIAQLCEAAEWVRNEVEALQDDI